jgi:hypothetical protein
LLLGSHNRWFAPAGVIAVPGDMHGPERILADARLRELINIDEPVCVILSAVLHFADAESARGLAVAFARALAPGSYLIISVGSGNPSEEENFTSAYTAAQIYVYSREEILSFFRRPRTRAAGSCLGSRLAR